MDCPLMRSQQPSLEERDYAMNTWKQITGYFGMASKEYDPMLVTVSSQAVVSQPAICMHNSARLDGFFHKRLEAVSRSIRHATHPNSPETTLPYLFYCHGNHNLLSGLAATNSRFGSTPVSLIDFDATRQTITPRPNHCAPQFVKPRPCCLIAAQAQDFLQSERAGTCLLTCHPPHGAKPSCQWHARILKDCSGRYRSLPATLRTFKQRSYGPRSCMATLGANESPRPTQLDQVIVAGMLACEPRFEFGQRPRKIIHTPVHYILGLPESSG
jgi:hypothetical protein